ncbi:MAG: multicopper oxidase domain-containing protein [Leptothrix sp. (in: b-proteobacteria)]
MVAGVVGTAGLSLAVTAQVTDNWVEPAWNDVSHYLQPVLGAAGMSMVATEAEPNHGAFEGGVTGTHVDPQAETSVPLSQQTSVNLPTNSRPSPMFGAQPFTQQMLMFEEFGTEKLDPSVQAGTDTLPRPQIGSAPGQDPAGVARSAPEGAALEHFLAQAGIAPYPTRFSNTDAENPWKADIETFLHRQLTSAPAEGRPPGEGWAHQRWNEFYPQAYYKTAQAGARVNGGFRDKRQLHGYKIGEFGPGGLYHNTAGVPATEGTTNGIAIRFHPNMPIQNHNSVWTFDGTMPPKLLMARYGQPIMMRHYNALPIDPAANKGFGLHTITTHEHNGHNPAESDGFAAAFFFPGQFYDYRWPMQLAGYDMINTGATDPRAAFPCSPGETLYVNDANPGVKPCVNGSIKIRGDWRETMSTHWFHDHMLDFTAQNVYKGNAVMMNYYSALDRGNEAVNDGVNLRLPSGSGMPWGNRDYDVNLVIADKAWDKDGQLWFNVFNKNGFLGDHLLTNWGYNPYLDVRARSYRFRILNGSVSRYLALALVQEVKGNGGEIKGPAGSNVSYNRIPIHMVANDGNIMEHAVPFDGTVDLDANGNKDEHKGQLPQQGIAERYDIVVDFSKYGIKPGDKLYFVNRQEHTSGEVTSKKIALADILSEKYKATTRDDNKDGVADRWINGDPCVGKFLELRVKAYAGKDLSMNPADYIAGKKSMIPLWLNRDSATDYTKLTQARHRSFVFGRSGGTDEKPWTVKADTNPGYNADMRVISAAPQLHHGPSKGGWSDPTGDQGQMEIWYLQLGGGWDHPIHVHFEEGIILRRGGKAPPEWEKWARKDVYRLGPDSDSGSSVEMAIRFREFAGTYVEHCHNTQHEDNAMLLRWDLERPGQFSVMPTPMPTWEGVRYVGTAALDTFRTGDFTGPSYKFGK